MKIYTRKGDGGSTRLLFGAEVRKDDAAPEAYGAVDEAQSAIGAARAETGDGSELDEILIRLERELWVVMAELATAPESRDKLVAGTSLVTAEMATALEPLIDEITPRFEALTEFVVPGQNRLAALLDIARTVVRRAERRALVVAVEGSHVVPYLNRLSDLLWTLARWQEGTALPTRQRETT